MDTAAGAAQAGGQAKLSITSADADEARTIAAILGEAAQPPPDAVTLFEEGLEWRVEAYFSSARPDTRAIASMLEDAIARPVRMLAEVAVPDENWVAISQAALPPVSAGRFTIHGSHDRRRVARGPNSLLIDAGEAFGTAHHATTLGCLLALGRIAARQGAAARNRRVLDLGCGSGVLAIAAARTFPAAHVLATDIDPVAVEVASANIAINGAMARVAALRADGLRHPALRGRPFDLVIANILAGPLVALAPGLARIVRTGGHVVLSGLLTHQADKVAATYGAAGFTLREHKRLAGWSTLTLVRRPARARGARPRRGG